MRDQKLSKLKIDAYIYLADERSTLELVGIADTTCYICDQKVYYKQGFPDHQSLVARVTIDGTKEILCMRCITRAVRNLVERRFACGHSL
jgi:hypothetical protein